jgi:hypothetical protein
MKDERDSSELRDQLPESLRPPADITRPRFDAARMCPRDQAAPVFETTELRKSLMYSIKEFPGVTGPIQFDERGDVKHNPIMFTIRDGEVLNFERFVKDQKKVIRERIRDLLLRDNQSPTRTPTPTRG